VIHENGPEQLTVARRLCKPGSLRQRLSSVSGGGFRVVRLGWPHATDIGPRFGGTRGVAVREGPRVRRDQPAGGAIAIW